MRAIPLALLLSLLAPLAAAQGNANVTADNETPPVGNTSPVGAESIEGVPGIAFGVLVVIGMLALGGALAYGVMRQGRRRP